MSLDIINKFIENMNSIFPKYNINLNKMTLGDNCPMSYVSEGKLLVDLSALIDSCNQISLLRLDEGKKDKATVTSGITLDIVRKGTIKLEFLNIRDSNFDKIDGYRLDKITNMNATINGNLIEVTIDTKNKTTNYRWEIPEGGIYGYKIS